MRGSSDEDSAASAASDYLSAFAAGDGEAACEELSTTGQKYIQDYAAARRLGTLDCAQALAQISPTLPHSQLELFSAVSGEIDADEVAISGNTGTITVPRTTTPLYVEKEGEDWKVSAAGAEGVFATSVP